MTDEQRRFSRVSFRVRAEMTVNNVLYSSEEINNLSVGGCLLPIQNIVRYNSPDTDRVEQEISNHPGLE